MPEPQLNGGYYGPSIPPPKKSYHRHSRGDSGCNPFSCCCNCICGCIFNCIFQIIITILVIAGILIFAICFITRPNTLKFYATDASLTQFEFNNTKNMLNYNLVLNMTVRNPNKRLGIYHDSIEVKASYEGLDLQSVQLDPFYQEHKNTSYLHSVFHGQNSVELEGDRISNYNEDKNSGFYHIDVKLYIKLRLKFWWFKSPHFKAKIDCNSLKVPLKSSGTFESIYCGYHWW